MSYLNNIGAVSCYRFLTHYFILTDAWIDRLIPTSVKVKVWQRDKGKCAKCASTVNLHYDYIIPLSRGGPSTTAANIQLMCARCNLQKHDNIE